MCPHHRVELHIIGKRYLVVCLACLEIVDEVPLFLKRQERYFEQNRLPPAETSRNVESGCAILGSSACLTCENGAIRTQSSPASSTSSPGLLRGRAPSGGRIMAGSTLIDNSLRDASLHYRVARRHRDQVLIEFYRDRLDRLLDEKLDHRRGLTTAKPIAI